MWSSVQGQSDSSSRCKIPISSPQIFCVVWLFHHTCESSDMTGTCETGEEVKTSEKYWVPLWRKEMFWLGKPTDARPVNLHKIASEITAGKAHLDLSMYILSLSCFLFLIFLFYCLTAQLLAMSLMLQTSSQHTYCAWNSNDGYYCWHHFQAPTVFIGLG